MKHIVTLGLSLTALTLALCTPQVARASGAKWTQIPGALKQISVGGASHVWGVNPGNDIFRWQGSDWQHIPGKLTNVAVGTDGTVWGVKAAGLIYRRDGSGWTQIPGVLKQIAVGGANHVWGVNPGNDIFRWQGSDWQHIPGKLTNVAVGADGTVWGVNAAGLVYRRDGSAWTQIPGGLKQISVGSASQVWGVNASNDIYRWMGNDWQHVPGKLTNVAVGTDGTVWGVNASDQIWRNDAGPASVGGSAQDTGSPVKETPPATALSQADLDSFKRDPLKAVLSTYASRPEVKGPMDAVLARVKAADGKLAEAIEKLAALATDAQGALGEWKTKQVCVPAKVTVKGSCKAHAQECTGWGVPSCSSRCVRWGKVIKSICEQYEKINCTSPCRGWRNTSTCLVWWPDSVRTDDVCSQMRYFDPSAGSIWKDARREAEKELEKAKAALAQLKKDIEEKAGGVLRELTGKIEGFIRNPPSLGDLIDPVPDVGKKIFEMVFELAGQGMLTFLSSAVKNATAVYMTPAPDRYATYLHARRAPAPMCAITDDPVKQIRGSMTASATGAILAATGKLKATYMAYGKNATLMTFKWRPGGAGRAEVKLLLTKLGHLFQRVAFFVGPAPTQRFAYYALKQQQAAAIAAQAPTTAASAAAKAKPPAGAWKETFKQTANKGALPMALVAIQWAAVGAAGPFAHALCENLMEPSQKAIEAYRACFKQHYILWSRATFFDALVGTAVGALDAPITQLTMGLSGALAAAVIASFPLTVGWMLPTAAVVGVAMKMGAIVGLTALADLLIPWYLQNYWPEDPNNPGVSNVKKFFTDQAQDASEWFPKQWYPDRYYADESKKQGRCSEHWECTGARECRNGYCWQDEAQNALGKNRCTSDTDCARPRYCEAAPTGKAAGRPRHCQSPK